VAHLSAAVAKEAASETPLSLNETSRAYFERLATISPPDRAARYRALLNAKPPASVEHYLAANEPQPYSMLRTSVSPTIIKGGFQANVMPSEAEATLDIRMTPGEDAAKFFDAMARVIDDPSVKIVPSTAKRPGGPPSELNIRLLLDLQGYRTMSGEVSRVDITPEGYRGVLLGVPQRGCETSCVCRSCIAHCLSDTVGH